MIFSPACTADAKPGKDGMPKKRPSAFAIACACSLGIFSGFIPLLAPANTMVSLILTFFRIPLLWFCACFAAAKFIALQYLDKHFADWGLAFLTSGSTSDIARRITQAPVLCYLQWNDTRHCGAALAGIIAGTAIAALIFAIVAATRRKRRPPP